jgi:hypothetical protein
MNEENFKHEIDHVVRRVLPLVHKHTSIGKKEFEAIHAEILQCLHESTGTSIDAIAEKMHTVLEALPTEYGHLSEKQRSWETLIGYLYVKYLKELGRQ